METVRLFKVGLIGWLMLWVLCAPASINASNLGGDPEDYIDWQYIDLGTANGDRHITYGFADANESPFDCEPYPGVVDDSARYQKWHQPNVIEFEVKPGHDLHLRFCVEKGYAQDRWVLLVNGYEACTSSTEYGLPHHYELVVPGRYITDGEVEIDFHNLSTDGIDGANTYGIAFHQPSPAD